MNCDRGLCQDHRHRDGSADLLQHYLIQSRRYKSLISQASLHVNQFWVVFFPLSFLPFLKPLGEGKKSGRKDVNSKQYTKTGVSFNKTLGFLGYNLALKKKKNPHGKFLTIIRIKILHIVHPVTSHSTLYNF